MMVQRPQAGLPVPTAGALHAARYLRLETFRRNGDSVVTPVWFAPTPTCLYAFSAAAAGKVKRIRNDPRVRMACCTLRGHPITGPIAARAYLIDEADEVAAGYLTLRRRYPAQMGIGDLLARLTGRIDHRQLIRIVPEEPGVLGDDAHQRPRD